MTSHIVPCMDPGALAAGDLIAFARGEAGTSVEQHVARCSFCRQETREYAWLERMMLSKLYRYDCPDTTRIGEYVLGLLSASELQAVAAHLAECRHCKEESNQFRTFLNEPDPVPAEIGLRGAFRRLIARPLAPQSPALSGLRGGGSGSGSVTYTVEGLRLTVSVQRAMRGTPGFVLAGLIELEAEPEPGTRASLFSGDHLLKHEDVDDLGNFMFSGVSAGEYRIEVSVPTAVVVIDPLQVA